MPPVGLEQVASFQGKTAFSEKVGTDSGTLQDETGTFPPDLVMVAHSWPHLSEDDRRRILAIVREASQTKLGGPSE